MKLINKKMISLLFKGELSKKEFMSLYIPAILFLVLAWGFARTVFFHKMGYEVESNFISSQGNIYTNPIGSWFFIISTAYMGIILFFYFIFLYHYLKPNLPVISHAMVYAGAAGGIGLTGVGVFPEHLTEFINIIHNTSATLAFSGLGLGALLSMIILTIKAFQKEHWLDPYHLAILVIIIAFFTLMLIPTHQDTIRQWTGFYIIFVWANVNLLVIPEKTLE
jgi:hypothetical protein